MIRDLHDIVHYLGWAIRLHEEIEQLDKFQLKNILEIVQKFGYSTCDLSASAEEMLDCIYRSFSQAKQDLVKLCKAHYIYKPAPLISAVWVK